MNTRLKKLLWIPRAILLLNFLVFLYYGGHNGSEIIQYLIILIEIVLFIAFFVLTFGKPILSGVLFILFSYIQPSILFPFTEWMETGYKILTFSMLFAGCLLIILTLIYQSKIFKQSS